MKKKTIFLPLVTLIITTLIGCNRGQQIPRLISISATSHRQAYQIEENNVIEADYYEVTGLYTDGKKYIINDFTFGEYGKLPYTLSKKDKLGNFSVKIQFENCSCSVPISIYDKTTSFEIRASETCAVGLDNSLGLASSDTYIVPNYIYNKYDGKSYKVTNLKSFLDTSREGGQIITKVIFNKYITHIPTYLFKDSKSVTEVVFNRKDPWTVTKNDISYTYYPSFVPNINCTHLMYENSSHLKGYADFNWNLIKE